MMLLHILVFFLGATVGSFLNVVIFRIPAGESVVRPASHCGGCGRRLDWLELVPILSFLMLRGRCRVCGVRISWQYPLVEMMTGLLFLLVWLTFGLSWLTISGWVFVAVLVAVTFIDLEHLIIPDKILLAGALLGLPFLALNSLTGTAWGFGAGLGAGLVMLAIALISKGGMGGGDVKLAAFMGLFLGPRLVIIGLFLAFLTGGVAGIILLVSGKKGRKDAIPFGPYLALGGLLALLQGIDILNWYMGLWS